MLIREAAVAGAFYPDDETQLQHSIKQLFGAAKIPDIKRKLPKALILPHAGYIYSGAVAASGYSLLSGFTEQIDRVVILGPSHRVAFHGIALPDSEYFSTPLGELTVDPFAQEMLHHLPFVFQSENAHLLEHSIEVHLPLLQSILTDFTIVPMVVGDATADEVLQVIECYLGKAGVLVIVSTDLSHFHDYQKAKIIDAATDQQIVERHHQLNGNQACGCRPLNGLLKYAQLHNLSVQQLDLCNSGDTGGEKSRVVGYGAYAVY